MKTKVAAVLMFALAGLSASCASSSQTGGSASGGSGRQCFQASQVNGFAAQTDRIVNVRVGVRDVYQFELMGSCPDVRWNQRLGIRSRGSSLICSGLDAEIISPTQIGPQRCPVRNIHRLTPEETEALPRGARP
ncbi:DUF6491 family protein [Phenylobacterium sp. LjRoot219]|uniref:DUF6491 family protein n=1 Tax=Phenylobacterium sp. LjRoot219 TaxID=3342283 RepID=UPI003ED01558